MWRWRWLLRRRVLLVALKAALASGLAFWLGSLLPAPVDQYKYYAALGAFTVVGLAVTDSVKESLQVFGAVTVLRCATDLGAPRRSLRPGHRRA